MPVDAVPPAEASLPAERRDLLQWTAERGAPPALPSWRAQAHHPRLRLKAAVNNRGNTTRHGWRACARHNEAGPDTHGGPPYPNVDAGQAVTELGGMWYLR